MMRFDPTGAGTINIRVAHWWDFNYSHSIKGIHKVSAVWRTFTVDQHVIILIIEHNSIKNMYHHRQALRLVRSLMLWKVGEGGALVRWYFVALARPVIKGQQPWRTVAHASCAQHHHPCGFYKRLYNKSAFSLRSHPRALLLTYGWRQDEERRDTSA